MRCRIYARYSTDQQRAASIADQVEVCQRYATRMGWGVEGICDDPAMSGASRMRPGLTRLMTDAAAGQFDVVLCESIDRLGRKLADVADLYDRLTFARVQIHAVNVGHVTQMHIGIMGTMAQMTLSDLRDKVRRGQLGRARAGRIPGGLAYGYEVVPPPPGAQEAGERRIKPDEAAIVQRIFGAFAGGQSARRIAAGLNAEGIPGPDGRPWIDTTIRGQVDRGTGLLNNTLYIGRLSWNRCSYIKDPATGRRVARVNPRSEWEETEVPELRIIDQDLWEQVKQRQEAVRIEMRDAEGNALNRAHRREYLLSGLLICGCCGGRYTVIRKDVYGCAIRRGRGTCDNRVSIRRQRIEARILGGLRQRMLTPELVTEFIRAHQLELQRLDEHRASRQTNLERDLAAVERRIEGVVRAIEQGAWNDSVRDRLTELERRKAELRQDLAVPHKPATPRLHPSAAATYAQKIAQLEAALSDPLIRREAAESLRSLIEKIVLTPDSAAPDGLAAELHGDLAAILSTACELSDRDRRRSIGTKNPQERLFSGGVSSVVAGTGFEPVTFRL